MSENHIANESDAETAEWGQLANTGSQRGGARKGQGWLTRLKYEMSPERRLESTGSYSCCWFDSVKARRWTAQVLLPELRRATEWRRELEPSFAGAEKDVTATTRMDATRRHFCNKPIHWYTLTAKHSPTTPWMLNCEFGWANIHTDRRWRNNKKQDDGWRCHPIPCVHGSSSRLHAPRFDAIMIVTLWHCRLVISRLIQIGGELGACLIGAMGMKTRVGYSDARIYSYGFWKSILIANVSLPPYNYPGWCPELKTIFVNRPNHDIVNFNEPYLYTRLMTKWFYSIFGTGIQQRLIWCKKII